MLVFCIAIVLFVLFPLAVFFFNFNRILGSHHEQTTAIEAAALSAARAISEIVIDDENFGLVGLSDAPPKGEYGNADDGFGTPVRAINTLLGTARLDLIIADQLDDNVLRRLCRRDYEAIMTTKDRLVEELLDVVERDQLGVNRDGKEISPISEAIAAYNANAIRMTGEQTKLIPGSLKLSLGCVPGLVTNTDVPSPLKFSSISREDQLNGLYLAYKNIPYDDLPFIFAGCGKATSLVAPDKFRRAMPSLPYTIPVIVRCEAMQRYSGSKGGMPDRVITAAACAQPGCARDDTPCRGGLIFNFDGGNLAEFPTPAHIFFHDQFKTSPVDFMRTVNGGDSPSTPPTAFVHPVLGEKNPQTQKVLTCALYDWIRRGGTRLNIEQLRLMLSNPFVITEPGNLHSFQLMSDGTIEYEVMPCARGLFLPISERQWSAVSGLAAHTSSPPGGRTFDCLITDFVYQSGHLKGGRHAGEPLALNSLRNPPVTDGSITNTNSLKTVKAFAQFPVGPGSGALRTTYNERNVAVAVHLHFRKL